MKLLFCQFNSFFLRLNFLELNPSLVLLSLGFSLCLSTPLQAADFRSILPAKAIAYDAPSVESTKTYIMTQGYPVEVIVNLGAWIKVRDQGGVLSWLEGKDVDVKKMVIVIANAEIKAAENAQSVTLATVEKDVLLEVSSSSINQGWVKVKHRDGVTGYIQSSAIWGQY